MELKGNDALDIYDDEPAITYLQTCECRFAWMIELLVNLPNPIPKL
jgi:hypothetical protein